MASQITESKLIHITGLVQGVGFRPFIFLLAEEHGIKGWVENRNDGVIIHAEEKRANLSAFIGDIEPKAPQSAGIYSIRSEETEVRHYKDFRIVKSESSSDDITEVSPDIAVCDACLSDIKSQHHRIHYPFINCTHCGPRFTIIRDLPYDRERTTMSIFPMCDLCRQEYENIRDRRFHAQPVACNHCGPVYTLYMDGIRITALDQILEQAANLIDKGEIIAIKGLGGFHIACDAEKEMTVRRLRSAKFREGKPFAIMYRDLETLQNHAYVSEPEIDMLKSWRKPVTLLKMKKELAASVSNGMAYTGIMLPYMPFHYLLFQKLKTHAIVLTSGNFSDEPIIIDNKKALDELPKITQAIITYNRDIQNRTDDSVVFITNNKPRLIRRSRGYTPAPVYLSLDTEGIFAAGAELVNCFAIGKGRQAILSQHIGDLKNPETFEFYEESFHRFKKLFRFEPGLVVHDQHPDYYSTQFAKTLDKPSLGVQHHHAHVASVMAEYQLDEDVIGISFDGTGLGTDSHIWGSEFMVTNLAGFDRRAHFEYMPMPGGDKVTHEPWRMALSYLYHYFGNEFLHLPFLGQVNQNELELLLMAMDKKINSPLSCGAGRLFDAVAALLNVCPISKFHAEAPMRLEALLDEEVTGHYSYEFNREIISFKKSFKEILADLQNQEAVPVISARFHNTIIQLTIEKVAEIYRDTGIRKVVLTGGTFQNRYLLKKLENRLAENKMEVFSPLKVPANDGGLALGQLAIAAKLRTLGKI